MIGIRRALKIGLMARVTIRRRSGKTIVDMALIAGRRHMRAEQRETRFVVIERRGLPSAGGVAARAVVREIRRRVIRIRGALKIRLMTREAIHRRAGEAIIHMAQIA